MIALVSLPDLGHAGTIELSRMLLARKLMPEDGRGTLSPMVNAPLAQSIILEPEVPMHLAGWLPRLKQGFADDMASIEVDPSLGRHISEMQDISARRNLIFQYFLPFQANRPIAEISTEAIVAAFDANAADPGAALDFGPLYPGKPENGLIRLPLPFLGMIYDQILLGRHSHLYLETRRRGGTNAAASDAVIQLLMEVMAANDTALILPPFRARKLSQRDFAQSFAYTQMMELGFSRSDMIKALTPWELVG